VRTTVDLPPAVHRRALEIAQRTGRSLSAVLDDELQSCRLLVAVIGPNWTTPGTGGREPRLHDADDVVRREIAVALRRHIPLLPLLVDATMPDPVELPADIRDITKWQAFRFDLGDYDTSVKRLARRAAEILR